jgi:hypothetical protein
MYSTEEQQAQILDILLENLSRGINSEYFYTHKLYRFPQRVRELRKKGYTFATVRDPLGGHNLARYWLVSDPSGKINNKSSIPSCAKIWGPEGRIKHIAPQIVSCSYTTDANGYEVAIPVYAHI